MAVRRDIPRQLTRAQGRRLRPETNRVLRGLRAQNRAVLNVFRQTGSRQQALAAADRAILNNPELRRAVVQLWQQGALDTIGIVDGILGIPPDAPPDELVVRRTRQYAGRRIRMINRTTARQVRESIAMGFDFGLTQEEIARGGGRRAAELRQTGWKPLQEIDSINPARARTIARTERALVYNRTAIDRYEMYEVTHAVAIDGDECGLRAHGVEPYANGRRYSLSTARRWPISHPNCVRAWAPDI